MQLKRNYKTKLNMSELKKRQLTVWAAINKNGSLSLHTEEPIRNEDTGIWVSKSPFINSVLYKDLSNMIEKTPMNWESNPQPFQLSIK